MPVPLPIPVILPVPNPVNYPIPVRVEMKIVPPNIPSSLVINPVQTSVKQVQLVPVLRYLKITKPLNRRD